MIWIILLSIAERKVSTAFSCSSSSSLTAGQSIKLNKPWSAHLQTRHQSCNQCLIVPDPLLAAGDVLAQLAFLGLQLKKKLFLRVVFDLTVLLQLRAFA